MDRVSNTEKSSSTKCSDSISTSQIKLSLIIPTYEERENLPPLLTMIQETLVDVNYEIVIVDDNSPDGTGQVAEELSHRLSNVKVVRRPGKMGLASAVIDGLKLAEGECIGVMDADLQHPPELLLPMFKAVGGGANLAVASRYVKGGHIAGWPWWRRLVSKGATLLAHTLLPKTRIVKDPMSGFFMFKRDVIQNVNFNPSGFKLLPEILVKGKCGEVIEVSYTFKARKTGKSKLNLKEYVNYLRYLFCC